MDTPKIPLILAMLFALLLAACSKSSDSSSLSACNNHDAVNYGKAGDCIFPRDSILGTYEVVVTSYPLQPLQEGDSFQMDVRYATCVVPNGDSEYKHIEIFALTGTGFYPTDWCTYLNGNSFVLPDTVANIFWALAPVSGTGSFVHGKFTFRGLVHSSVGDSAIVLESTRFVNYKL